MRSKHASMIILGGVLLVATGFAHIGSKFGTLHLPAWAVLGGVVLGVILLIRGVLLAGETNVWKESQYFSFECLTCGESGFARITNRQDSDRFLAEHASKSEYLCPRNGIRIITHYGEM